MVIRAMIRKSGNRVLQFIEVNSKVFSHLSFDCSLCTDLPGNSWWWLGGAARFSKSWHYFSDQTILGHNAHGTGTIDQRALSCGAD